MTLKLKTKVALGGIFLFALLILVGAVSFIYLNRITGEAKDIIKDNYETLDYSKDMLKELDELNGKDSLAAFTRFEQTLQLQEKNITEPDEKEMTGLLRKNFNGLKQKKEPDSLRFAIRRNISAIMQANLQAIDKKNRAATASAEKAKTIITLILTICTLIGLVFIYNFPSLIASPIAKLTEGIKAIANKNYSLRIHLNRKDEFGDLVNAFNSMAEKLDKYEHSNLSKILFEKQRAETVINSLKDASIGIDNKGTILFANHQALQLLSLKEQDIIGLSRDTVQKKNDLFHFLINEQNNIPFKIVLEGKENYFTKEIITISHQEEKIGYMIIVENITPFKELDTAKTNFIATISHELKTPLASSDFSLKLLEDERVGTLTPEQKDLVQSLKNDNQRLLRILSELLDLSQVESGRMQLNIQETSIYGIMTKAEQSVANAIKEKNLDFKKEMDENLPLVKADAEKTTWTLINFLTNAIKYSPENGTIILKATRRENQVEIGVRDFGIGIDEPFQTKIFDRYFKVPGTKEKKGTGLGLAISKDFIEAMGGAIGVESQTGNGSYFFLRLPVA
jgi:two-component system, NtrC family, sensor histidine kinase KinB